MSTQPKDITNDRNYLRQLYNCELVEHAEKQAGLTDLEIVLTERLKEAEYDLEDRNIPATD